MHHKREIQETCKKFKIATAVNINYTHLLVAHVTLQAAEAVFCRNELETPLKNVVTT